MATEKNTSDNPVDVYATPPVQAEPEVKAGPGQKVVTSPTGAKSVVEESAVATLKTQGYTVA